jgi:integrase
MNKESTIQYQSVLAPMIERFIEEKRACGYKYVAEADSLRRLDRFLCEQELTGVELPKGLVQRWIAKGPNESLRTHRARIGLVRRFANFLVRQGCTAYVPDTRLGARRNPGFVPRILTTEEMRRLLAAADAIPANPRSPLRHRLIPEIIRLLYGCGLRVSEATHLRFKDVNLGSGVLTIEQGKFRNRLVPITASLTARLEQYVSLLSDRSGEACVFPSPRSGPYPRHTIYHAFRQLLWECQIPHGGRGHGPRLHDLRHYAASRIMPTEIQFLAFCGAF